MARNSREKLCVFCKHFNLDMGTPYYSELTPGIDAVIECDEGHWRMENYEGTEIYRNNILKAVECVDFTEATLTGTEIDEIS